MRSRLARILFWCLAVAVTPCGAMADGGRPIAIVVHPESPVKELSLGELRNIFLGQKKQWSSGESIVPLYLVPTSDVSAAFSQKALGKSLEDLEKYWIDERIRGGAKKPRTVPTSATARKLVGSLPNAIAYIPLADVDGTVRVIAIDGVAPSSGGYRLKY